MTRQIFEATSQPWRAGSRWSQSLPKTIQRYGENTMPGGNRPPAGVGLPASTADVQLIVRAAKRIR